MKDGNEVAKTDTVVTLDKLARNVVDDQSLDDSVVSHRVMVVVKHPSAIKCGISLVLSGYRHRTL